MAHLCLHSHTSRHRRAVPEEPAAAPKPLKAPTHEEIAMLAYRFWEARGRPQGSGVEDWLRAERELSPHT